MKKKPIFNGTPLRWMVWVLILPLLGACQKEQSCVENLIVETRAPFGGAKACGFTHTDWEEINSGKPYVISKREDIGSFRACSEADDEEIDFEKEFLVGVRICSACGILKKQEVRRQCDKLVYTIEIENSICAAITCESYFLLIPKEYLNYPIEMDIIKTN